jgi:hypothetical protein
MEFCSKSADEVYQDTSLQVYKDTSLQLKDEVYKDFLLSQCRECA